MYLFIGSFTRAGCPCLIVRLDGTLTGPGAVVLVQQLGQRIYRRDLVEVIVDVREVQAFDAEAVAALIALAHRLRHQQCRLRVVYAPGAAGAALWRFDTDHVLSLGLSLAATGDDLSGTGAG